MKIAITFAALVITAVMTLPQESIARYMTYVYFRCKH